MIIAELTVEEWVPPPRCTDVLGHLGIATSNWYRPISAVAQRPRPAPRPLPQEIVDAVITMATANPWYGYKRIAVMCRRARARRSKDREAYLVMRASPVAPAAPSRAAEVLPGGQVVRTVAATTERPLADGRDLHPHPRVRLVVCGARD